MNDDEREAQERLRQAQESRSEAVEGLHEAQEGIRQAQEGMRETRERIGDTSRQHGEVGRVTREDARGVAEGSRDTAEEGRDTAETKRVNAERRRNTAGRKLKTEFYVIYAFLLICGVIAAIWGQHQNSRIGDTANDASVTAKEVRRFSLRNCRRSNVQHAYERGTNQTSARVARRLGPAGAKRLGITEKELNETFKRDRLARKIFPLLVCESGRRFAPKDEQIYIDAIKKGRAPIVEKNHVVGTQPFPRAGPPAEVRPRTQLRP